MASSEESGKDWSELEEEAAAADKTRHDFVDDYTQRRSKGGAPPPKSKGPPKKHSSHSSHSTHSSKDSSMRNGSMNKRKGYDSKDKSPKKFKK